MLPDESRAEVRLTGRSFPCEVIKLVSERQNNRDLSELIAENFGANATYVEGLLSRFRSDPALVDESWRAYFAELLGTGDAAAAATTTTAQGAGATADGLDNGRGAVTPATGGDAKVAAAMGAATAAATTTTS